MKEYLNEAIIQGPILSIIQNREGMAVEIETKVRGEVYRPRVEFYGKNIVAGLKVGDNITVFGYMQNHLRERENGKSGSVCTIVGEKIERTKRYLHEFFSKEDIPEERGGGADDRNEIVMIGDVMNIYVPDKDRAFAILKVCVKDDQHKGQCDFVMFERQAREAKKLSPGDKVAIAGYYSTKPPKNDPKKPGRSVICRDIYHIIKRAEVTEEDI